MKKFTLLIALCALFSMASFAQKGLRMQPLAKVAQQSLSVKGVNRQAQTAVKNSRRAGEELVTVPEGVSSVPFIMYYSDKQGLEHSKPVNTAIDGNDVYIQGFSEYLPEAWVKGTKDGNSVTFAGNQYMGKLDTEESYFFYGEESVVFTYDAEEDSYSFAGEIFGIIADKYDDGLTLFAGAADLFTEVLASYTSNRSRALVRDVTKCPDPNVTLILCGSTQSKPLDVGIPISPMPKEIYDGSTDITLWDTRDYEKYHKLILTIPYTHRTGKEAATHLRQVMAMMAKRLVDIRKPDRLIIEGGATAWATLKVLGWTQFSIVSQHAPGVVTMKAANGPLVTLKPGSYPWGFMSHRGQDTL